MSKLRKFTFNVALAGALVVGFAGVAPAQTLEGAMSDYRGGDVNAARQAWASLAEAGDADALFNLGQIYRYGYGVEASLDTAALYLTQAGSMGHYPAQREMANLYFYDIGTPDLKRTAINLWQTAARNGDGRAQYTLGVLFFTGDMVPRNQPLGFAWTLLATEAGVPEAIQLQTAMQAQLSQGDLQKGLELSSTLMTGTGFASNHTLLVNEMPQLPRHKPPVVQTAEAEPEATPAVTIPEPELAPEETIAEAVAQEPEAEAVHVAEAQPEPDSMTQAETPDDPPQESPEEIAEEIVGQEQTFQVASSEPVVAMAETKMEEQPASTVVSDENSDEYNETRQVLAGLIEETSPESTPDAQPQSRPVVVAATTEERDLGDPDSPLVDSMGFGNDWSLQLTSFRRPENAETHWQDMMRDHPDLFTDLEKRILRFDLGPDKGIYYRLRVGPFASKETADQKCNELSENQLGCLVIWP